MLNKANYLEDLVNDFNLTFKLKNHSLSIERKEQNVLELVNQAVENLKTDPRATGFNIQFHTDLTDSLIYPLDSKWFRRALDNLLANAIIHNKPGTLIEVSVEEITSQKQFNGMMICISDNGRGMNEQTLQHL